MEGGIDIRLVVTIAGILFSVAGASAVAKMQIKQLVEKLDDIEHRLRKMDARSDKLITSNETQEQRINILAKMASPENLRRDHMQMAEIVTHVQRLQKDCDRLYSMHNGTHPPVPSERVGK
jgi:septal ring factor EnvC (AmiA/AmiB activator)